MAAVIHEEFGVEYSEWGTWCLLRDIGFEAPVPLPRAPEGDVGAFRRRAREEWPKVQSRARRAGATALFLEESGPLSLPNVRRT